MKGLPETTCKEEKKEVGSYRGCSARGIWTLESVLEPAGSPGLVYPSSAYSHASCLHIVVVAMECV